MKLNCVLLVDDDRVSNFITEKVLNGMGVTSMVTTAYDGKKGLDYIKYQCTDDLGTCPDLILLDINMPLIDGREFVDRYHKIPRQKECVIVVLSATDLPDAEKTELRNAGVSEFLVKPLNADKINDIVQKYFVLEE